MPIREYYPDEKPFKMAYVKDSFGIVFKIYTHSHELTYSSGAHYRRLKFLYTAGFLQLKIKCKCLLQVKTPMNKPSEIKRTHTKYH